LQGETTAECAAEGLGGVYKISKPHRIIHCSDGVVEEFSDDEEYQVDAAKITAPPVDPVKIQIEKRAKFYYFTLHCMIKTLLKHIF